MLDNTTVNIFLTNLKIVLFHVLFIKYLWIYNVSLVSIELKPKEKNYSTIFNPIFFILLVEISFEILPKHSA